MRGLVHDEYSKRNRAFTLYRRNRPGKSQKLLEESGRSADKSRRHVDVRSRTSLLAGRQAGAARFIPPVKAEAGEFAAERG